MADDNTVKIDFVADTSSMTSAFSQVNSELAASQAKGSESMAAWRKETGLAAQPVIDLNRQMVQLRDHAGKTAADFKPATAEMRAASVAAEDLGKKGASSIGAFRGTMRALRFDIFEVVAVLGIMAKAMEEAAKSEASQRHAGQQGISNVSVIKLEGAARAENFEPHQYDDAAISLKVAGMAEGDLTENVKQLGIASRITGEPFEKLVETAAAMTEELETGGIPSLSQMTTLTVASSGATQELTDEYRELERTLKLTEQAWRVQEEVQARSHKQTEENTSVVNTMAEKMGVTQKVFAEFQGNTLIGGQSLSTTGTGNFAEGRQGKAVLDEYKEGYKQIQTEQGYTRMQMDQYIKAGTIGYQDLISGSQRYRAHQQEELTFTQKQRDEQLRLGTEAKQRALGLAALQSVMAPSDWKNQQAELQKASPEGVAQVLQAQATNAMVELGKVIAKWFPEIKVAMMFLAGVEIASRLAALNSRFFPNAFKPPGASLTRNTWSNWGTSGRSRRSSRTSRKQHAAIGPWGAILAEQMAHNADPIVKANNESVNKAAAVWWSKITGGQAAATQPAPTGITPPATNSKATGSPGPLDVQDPKMQDLIQQLLKVFTTA